jgi:hypothetical protein
MAGFSRNRAGGRPFPRLTTLGGYLWLKLLYWLPMESNRLS